jgi:protein-S-isoprenylcysteine O-methyltransferase Ste14
MNQYENLSQEQAHAVLDMLTSEQKRAKFEADRKKRIKQLQTLPKKWIVFLVILGLFGFGIGIFFDIRITVIVFSILIAYSIAQLAWRYQSRNLVMSIQNERFEA